MFNFPGYPFQILKVRVYQTLFPAMFEVVPVEGRGKGSMGVLSGLGMTRPQDDAWRVCYVRSAGVFIYIVLKDFPDNTTFQ